jgi:hypothetical protein
MPSSIEIDVGRVVGTEGQSDIRAVVSDGG